MVLHLDAQNWSDDEMALVQGFLDSYQDLHDGNRIIDKKEVSRLLDRDADHDIDLDDWRLIASDLYLISQSAFQHLVEKFSQALPKTCRVVLNQPSKESEFPVGEAKADLHVHFGGNISIEFLYQQALDRVGPDALDPDRWGGRLDWVSDASHTDYNDFSRKTFDEVVALAKKGKLIPEAEYRASSVVVAEGQRITRELSETTDPARQAKLKEQLSDNFREFERLATYEPQGKGNLVDFLNVYRFQSALVERNDSHEVQTEAMNDTLRRYSGQNVGYVEMRIGTPKLKEAQKLYPKLEPQEAMNRAVEDKYTHLVGAIRKTNQDLIAEGLDPVELRIIYTLSKSAAHDTDNLYQVNALVWLLETKPDLSPWIIGVDGSAKEPGELPQMYEDHLAVIQAYNGRVVQERQLGITWHQGEDFSDTSVFAAIRRVEEIVDLGATRVGHALVLGLDPELFIGQSFSMTAEDYLRHLHYEKPNRFRYPIHTCVDGAEVQLDDEITRVEALLSVNPKAKVSGIYPADGRALRERQDFVLAKLREAQVAIEVNPTSNRYMGLESGDFSDHPLPYFLQSGVAFSINTDDAGIFNTDLNQELDAACTMIKCDEEQGQRVVQSGFDQSFAVTVRGESLSHLYEYE